MSKQAKPPEVMPRWCFVKTHRGKHAEFRIFRDDRLGVEKTVLSRVGSNPEAKEPLAYYQLDDSETIYYREEELLAKWREELSGQWL